MNFSEVIKLEEETFFIPISMLLHSKKDLSIYKYFPKTGNSNALFYITFFLNKMHQIPIKTVNEVLLGSHFYIYGLKLIALFNVLFTFKRRK